MGNLDLHNARMVEEYESNWLNPDYNFFTSKSTNVELEREKEEEEYDLSDEEVEKIKSEWEVDDLTELDKYDWTEVLEELVGGIIVSDDIVKIDLERNIITYTK